MACPSHDQLEQFLSGHCDAQTARLVGCHVETCDACRARVELAAGEDDLIAQLRSAVRSEGLSDDNSYATSGLDALPHKRRPLPDLAGYSVDRIISQTHLSVVYEGVQHTTGQQVAIKRLIEGTLSDQARRRFCREVDLARSLQHPGIVPIIDAGLGPDRCFFVMPFVTGLDPVTFADRNNLGFAQRLRLVRRVCEPLRYAHRHGVIHRDLKPSNMLIDGDGEPHVLDFGLGKLAEPDNHMTDLTLTGQLLGTPAYMAPEQADGRNQEIDVRADVYSLGVIAYRVLVGRMPYPEEPGIASALEHIRHTDPEIPSRHNRELKGDTDAVLLMALAKRPADRYESVASFAADLDHLLSGQPVLAKPHSTLYLCRKMVARHPGWSSAAVLALVALATMAVAAGLVASHRRTAITALEQTAKEQAARLAAADARRAALGRYYRAIDLIKRNVRLDDALQLLDESLQLDPTFSAAYLERGLLSGENALQHARHAAHRSGRFSAEVFRRMLNEHFADFERAHRHAGGDWLVDPATGRQLTPIQARNLPVGEDGRIVGWHNVYRRWDGACVQIRDRDTKVAIGGPGLPRALVSAGNTIAAHLSRNSAERKEDRILTHEMLRYFERAAALDSDDLYTRLSPALSAAVQPDRQEEASRLLAALANDPEARALVEYWLAAADVALGGPRRLIPEFHGERDPVEAEHAAQQAIQVAPYNIHARYLLGLALAAQQRYAEAGETNRYALDLLEFRRVESSASQDRPSSPFEYLLAPLLTNLATCHARLGQFEQAWPRFEQAIEPSGRSPIVLIERAHALHLDGQPQRAKADLDEAARLLLDNPARSVMPKPGLLTAWDLLMFPDVELRNPNLAREIILRICRNAHDAEDPAVITLLLVAHVACGDPDLALKMSGQYADRLTDRPFAAGALAIIHTVLGQPELTRPHYERLATAADRLPSTDPRLTMLMDEVQRERMTQ